MAAVIVVTPESPEFILATDVPALELDILVLQCFHVESNGWNGVHSLVHLEFVEDCCFAGCVESKKEDADVASE